MVQNSIYTPTVLSTSPFEQLDKEQEEQKKLLEEQLKKSLKLSTVTNKKSSNISNQVIKKVTDSIVKAYENGVTNTDINFIIEDTKRTIEKDFKSVSKLSEKQSLDNISLHNNLITKLNHIEDNLTKLLKGYDGDNEGYISHTFSIRLNTVEGDNIDIKVSKMQRYSLSLNVTWDKNNPYFKIEREYSETTSMKTDIRGNLNNEEKKVLKQVVKSINRVTDGWKNDLNNFIWDGGAGQIDFDTSSINSVKITASRTGNKIGNSYIVAGTDDFHPDAKQELLKKRVEEMIEEANNTQVKNLLKIIGKIDLLKDISKDFLKKTALNLLYFNKKENKKPIYA